MSIRIALAIPLGYGLILAAGDAVRERVAGRLTWGLERLGLDFALGVGSLTFASFLVSVLMPGAIGAVSFTALALLIAATPFVVQHLRGAQASDGHGVDPGVERSPPSGRLPETKSDPWSLAIGALIAVLGLASVVRALGTDFGVDGEVIWGLKAHLAFAAGGFPTTALDDTSRQWSHLDYPWALPLGEAFFAFLSGEASAPVLKAILPGFFVALLALFAAAVRRLHGARLAFAATALLGAVPALLDYSATGHADLPLALAVLGSATSLHRWALTGRARDARLAGLLAAFGAWTKNEGLVFLVVAIVAVLLADRPRAERARAARILAFSGALVAGPWLALVALHHTPRNDFLPLTLETLAARRARIPEIARWTWAELELTATWGLLWPIVALALVVWRRAKARAQLVLLVCALGPIPALLGAYVFSQFKLVQHLAWSLDRVLLPAAVVSALFAATQLGRCTDRGAPSPSPPGDKL